MAGVPTIESDDGSRFALRASGGSCGGDYVSAPKRERARFSLITIKSVELTHGCDPFF